MNNLLERLHASLFFYLYLRPGRTHKVGSYLPAAVLIGAGLSILALGRWPRIGSFRVDGTRGPRPVLSAIALIVLTHVVYAGFLASGTQHGWFEAMLVSLTASLSAFELPLIAAYLGALFSHPTRPRLPASAPLSAAC